MVKKTCRATISAAHCAAWKGAMRFAYVIHGCISVARGRPFLRILRPRHLYIRVRQMPEPTMEGQGRKLGGEGEEISTVNSYSKPPIPVSSQYPRALLESVGCNKRSALHLFHAAQCSVVYCAMTAFTRSY